MRIINFDELVKLPMNTLFAEIHTDGTVNNDLCLFGGLTDSGEDNDYWYRDLISVEFDKDKDLFDKWIIAKENSSYGLKPDFTCWTRYGEYPDAEERKVPKYIIYSNEDIEGMIKSLKFAIEANMSNWPTNQIS
jgi:hypothetical protein